MFSDKRFGCSTIPTVRKEIFRTEKFKKKYPWRDSYKAKIKTLGSTALNTKDFHLNLSTISSLIDSGIENTKTGLLVDLSYTDKTIIACAAAQQYNITSGDHNLVYFAEKEFDISNVSPLEIVNQWLEEELVVWDDQLQMVIEDWERCEENKQPIEEIKRFEKLTGYQYVGP